MSATDAEGAELLQCARILRQPVLPMLRYSDKLPRHLTSLRSQPTGRMHHVPFHDSPHDITQQQSAEQHPELWKLRPIDCVSDVLFHDAVANAHGCLLELLEQQKTLVSSESRLHHEVQHGLFSRVRQSLPQPIQDGAAQWRNSQCVLAEHPDHSQQPAPAPPPPPPPPLPPVRQQQQEEAEEEQNKQHNKFNGVAAFPELLSARLSILSEDLAAMNQRVATLERAAGRGSGGAFSMGSLERRIAALEAETVSAPPVAELAARLNALEQSVSDAGSARANGEHWHLCLFIIHKYGILEAAVGSVLGASTEEVPSLESTWIFLFSTHNF